MIINSKIKFVNNNYIDITNKFISSPDNNLESHGIFLHGLKEEIKEKYN